MPSQLNISTLLADWGAYYMKGSQSLKNLHLQMYRGAQFDSLFTYVPTTDTVLREVPVSMTEVLQAYQETFTPKGDLSMLPVEIDLYPVKVDDQKNWDKLEASYVGFLTGEGLDRKTWPVSRWFMESLLLPKLVEDVELNAFKAVKVNPTAGTPGNAIDSLNGFRKYIKDRIAAGDTSIVYNTGALVTDPADFVTQIEDWVALLPDNIRIKKGFFIAMNPTLILRYKKGMRAKYNVNYKQQDDPLTLIDFPNINISEQPSMAGSSKIFASFKENLLLGVKRPNKDMQFESVDRSVKYWHDHWRGYGFVDKNLFFTNDLENT